MKTVVKSICVCLVVAAVNLGHAADAPTGGPDTLKLAAGLEATLFAAEPLLSSPSDIGPVTSRDSLPAPVRESVSPTPAKTARLFRS